VGGVARRATAIEEARKRQPSLVLLDAGNALVNDMEPAVSSKGATSIEALNRLGYQAVALGDRDLSLGLGALRERLAEAKFPMLSANVVVKTSDERLAQAYAILNVQGHRVGVIGVTGQPAQNDLSPFEVKDPLQALREVLPVVVERSDFVIVLSNASAAQRREIVRSMPEVDLVISAGDDFINPPEAGEAGGLIVQADHSTPYHAGLHLGILRLTLDRDNQRQQYVWESLSLGPEIPDEPAIAEWVATQAG